MKIKIKKQNSYAKWYLPINIICVGCLNHVQVLWTNIAVISTIIYMLLLFVDILVGRDKYNKNFMDPEMVRKTRIEVYVFIMYITLQTSILAVCNNNYGIINHYMLMVVNLILFVSVIHHTHNYEDIFRYSRCVVACTVVEILICFYEIRTGLHVRNVAQRWYSDVVFGTYYNENDLCVMLALGILCVVYLMQSIKKRKKIKLILAVTIIVTSFYMILKTHARGGLLGVVLFGALLLLGLMFGRKYDLTGKVFKVGGKIGILLLLIFFVTGILNITDENDIERLRIYGKTVSTIFQHPMSLLFGLGSGQLSTKVGLATHNYILQLLGEYGIFGVCLYIKLITRMMKWSSLKNASVSDMVKKVCSFSAALLLLGFGLVVSDFGSIKLGWVVFGILYVEALHEIKESNERMVIESGI